MSAPGAHSSKYGNRTEKFELITNLRQSFETCFFRIAVLRHYIALQRLSLFSNSEISIYVAPQSSFYTFKEILCSKQPLRSSHQCSVRKGVLRNFAKFTGKHLCRSPFFKKVASLACNFIKKEARHSCFPVNFVKFLRTPSLQNTSGRLLLAVCRCFQNRCS